MTKTSENKEEKRKSSNRNLLSLFFFTKESLFLVDIFKWHKKKCLIFVDIFKWQDKESLDLVDIFKWYDKESLVWSTSSSDTTDTTRNLYFGRHLQVVRQGIFRFGRHF